MNLRRRKTSGSEDGIQRKRILEVPPVIVGIQEQGVGLIINRTGDLD